MGNSIESARIYELGISAIWSKFLPLKYYNLVLLGESKTSPADLAADLSNEIVTNNRIKILQITE